MKRLFSAVVVLAALSLPSLASAQDCPFGTEYEHLWDEEVGDTTYTHYRCADRACEANADRDIEATAGQCDDLTRRILHFPDVEAHLDQVTTEQLRRARQDLYSDLRVMFDEIERAALHGSHDAPAVDSLRADLERMAAIARRGGELQELQPYVSKVNRALAALGLIDLLGDVRASWESLERLIQQETDAERLRGMLEAKKLNLEIQLGACSRRLGEAKERRSNCSRAW